MLFIPTLLANTDLEFNRQLQLFAPYFAHFQVDVQDGDYVPSKTIDVLQCVKCINNLNLGNFKYDFHLMLKDYEPTLSALNSLSGFKGQINAIFVHLNFNFNNVSKYSNLSICPAFSPANQINASKELILNSKYAQVMTINPGPQGQSMMFDQFVKLDQIRQINPNIKICIDGGANSNTVNQIAKLPTTQIPDWVGVGSYFSKCKSPLELQAKINEFNFF